MAHVCAIRLITPHSGLISGGLISSGWINGGLIGIASISGSLEVSEVLAPNPALLTALPGCEKGGIANDRPPSPRRSRLTPSPAEVLLELRRRLRPIADTQHSGDTPAQASHGGREKLDSGFDFSDLGRFRSG